MEPSPEIVDRERYIREVTDTIDRLMRGSPSFLQRMTAVHDALRESGQVIRVVPTTIQGVLDREWAGRTGPTMDGEPHDYTTELDLGAEIQIHVDHVGNEMVVAHEFEHAFGIVMKDFEPGGGFVMTRGGDVTYFRFADEESRLLGVAPFDGTGPSVNTYLIEAGYWDQPRALIYGQYLPGIDTALFFANPAPTLPRP